MPSSLSRRVRALEDGAPFYQSITDIPDEALESMLAPLCGVRAPTDDDLIRISLNIPMEQQHAKP